MKGMRVEFISVITVRTEQGTHHVFFLLLYHSIRLLNHSKKKKKKEYRIEVYQGNEFYPIMRRYKEIAELHKLVKIIYSTLKSIKMKTLMPQFEI